jgi:hypothetical protein
MYGVPGTCPALDLQNLLKYWPYILGTLSSAPQRKVVLCHFSSWSSYGSRRDLWAWVLCRMAVDPDRVMDIEGELFDNGGIMQGVDEAILSRNLDRALDYVDAKATLVSRSA